MGIVKEGGRPPQVTPAPRTSSPSGDKFGSMWEVNGPGDALPSDLIRKWMGLSCITSELALNSSSQSCRREDESRALTFT